MCGRYYALDEAAMVRAWHFGARSYQNPFSGTYNAAPSQLLPIMRAGPTTEGLELVAARWGILPGWASKIRPQINARAEIVATKPLFRRTFKSGRCLVPAGWYEWSTVAGEKWPHFVTRRDGQLFCFAGIETVGADGWCTYAIITCDAATDLQLAASAHAVVLDRQAEERWLEDKDVGRAQELLRPAAAGVFSAVKVSKRVNSPVDNDAQLIEAVE